MKMVRLGFIGCGGHAYSSHGLVADKLPELFRITSAFDPNLEVVDQFVKLAPDLYRASSAEDLLARPDVDAVVIATPHQFHLTLMEKAVAAGKHVLCEKPLWVGDYARVMWKIIEEAEKRKLVLTSCHPRRYERENVRLKMELLEYREAYGRLEEFNFRFFYHKPSTDWKKEDSLLLDHMNHEIDLVNFLLGHAPFYLRRVCDSFDRYQVVGRREDGVSLCFSGYRRLENRIYNNELELIFDRGRVRVLSSLKKGLVETRVLEEHFDAFGATIDSPRGSAPYNLAFFDVMRNFGETILGRAKNYLTISDLLTNTVSCNVLLEEGYYHQSRNF